MKFEEIEEIICNEIGITSEEFKSGRNKAEFVAAKMLFVHFACSVSLNNKAIADHIKQREATVYFTKKRYDNRVETDRVFRNVSNTIERLLKETINV